MLWTISGEISGVSAFLLDINLHPSQMTAISYAKRDSRCSHDPLVIDS
jgi:hypothetical protein